MFLIDKPFSEVANQQASKFTNDVNRFHFIEKPSKRITMGFSQTPFFLK